MFSSLEKKKAEEIAAGTFYYRPDRLAQDKTCLAGANRNVMMDALFWKVGMIALTADRTHMKTRNPFVFYLMLAFSAFLSMLTLSAHCQVYSFSAPVAGFCNLDVMDYSDFENGQFAHATSEISLNTLTETVYYDPIAQTLRQVGSVSLNAPTNVTLSFIEHVHVNSSPQTATVTVNFSFPPILSFDTGFQASSGANNEFIIAPPTIPITGTYSILAGDQTLTGLFDYSLLFPSLVTDVSAITPASLVISQTPIGPTGFFAPDIARSVTAANGMDFNLVGGVSDGTYRSSWSLDRVTATAVPEPEISLLFSTGLLVFGFGACRSSSPSGWNLRFYCHRNSKRMENQPGELCNPKPETDALRRLASTRLRRVVSGVAPKTSSPKFFPHREFPL